MNIYSYTSSAKIIKNWVGEKKKTDKTLNFTSLAEGIGVQKAFISQVLTDKANLNLDQAFQIAQHLNFNEEEKEYFLLIVEKERSGLASRKEELTKKIKELQKNFGGSKKSVQAHFLDTEKSEDFMREYFLDPYHSIVHVHLTVPEHVRNPFGLAEKLGLSRERLERIFKVLHGLEVIEFEAKKKSVKVLKERLHTVDQNQLNANQQVLFRALSLERLITVQKDKRMAFNVTYSADAKTFAEVQKEFHIFIQKVGELVGSAPASEVYQLNFDLFPWS